MARGEDQFDAGACVRGKIVVADDQAINLEILKMHLRRLDVAEHQVVFCRDGRQCVEASAALCEVALRAGPGGPVQPIQVVLLDFQMPFKNGLEVVGELRRFFAERADRLAPPAFVFLTAFVTPAFVAHARRHGVHESCEKPISLPKLKAILRGEFEEDL